MEIMEKSNISSAGSSERTADNLKTEANGIQDSAIRAFMDRFIQTESGTPSIDELMGVIGRYFDADRSYIFEQDSTGRYSVNTYEWCAEGVTSEIQNLQEVPLSVLDPWWKEFRKKGSFYLSCNDEYAKQEPLVYEVLEPQGITGLIAAPFMLGSEIIGFLGVDNPKIHIEQQLFLSVAAAMLNHEILVMRESKKEQERQAELQAALDLAKESSTMLNEVHEVLGAANWKIEFDAFGKCINVKWSDGVRRLFGYETKEEFPDTLDFPVSRVHPDDRAKVMQDVNGVVSEFNRVTLNISTQFRACRKDGSLRRYRMQGMVKRREDGAAKVAYGVIRDITDQAKAENAQKEALEALEACHEALGSAKWQMNFDESGKMISCTWSDRFRRMVGYHNTEDFPDKFESWTDLLHPSDKKMTLKAYWDAANDRTGKTLYSVEYRLLTRTKGYRWYAAHGSLTRYDDGTPKVYYGMFLDINDQVLAAQSQAENLKEISELNLQLEEKQNALEAVSAEQEAQLEEISALNEQLENNQAELEASAEEEEFQLQAIAALNEQLRKKQSSLEEASAEQEAQLEETQALNRELQETRDRISEAYGMIEGFSREYHTIWVVNKETSRMRLIRSNGRSTIKRAVQMGIDEPLFDPAVVTYVSSCVEPQDRERMLREICFAEVMRQLQENPNSLYAVNYLRRDDSGHVGYHQIAFANADTADGIRQFVYGFRDIDQIVREEQLQKEELREALDLAQEATAEQEAQLEEITALNAQLENNQAELEAAVAEQEAQLAKIRELNHSLNEYNNIMANAGYGMWRIILKDGAAPRMQVNDKMAELLGIAGKNLSEEELYNSWYDQIVPDAIPSVQASVGEMMAGHFSENTYQWVHPAKGVIYVRCGGTAVKLADGTNILSGYHADVTEIVLDEQKQKEALEEAKQEAEAANAAKTSFLFNMSHDIRTPMNAIMGFRDLLEKHQEDRARRQDYLDKIQDASTVLLSIINNVLEMARIEKGTLEIEETAWSAEQFSDTMYSVFHIMMEEKGLRFTRQLEIKHHYIYCDPTKLREIFINILSNAYKYTNAGGSVNMRVVEIPSDRAGWVKYQTTVSDTGIGMSKEFLPHIFEEFSRENNTTDAKVEGTGLGMPIVKRLVEMMNGTIEVKSRKDEGSSFIITIPHRIAEKAEIAERVNVEVEPQLFQNKHILLAEDNDLNAEIANEILSEAGFIVERAEDGAICVDKVKAAQAGYYDLILMDIQMPNMNGYEAAGAIRQLEDSEKANIKILAMTANAFEEDKREALKAGMNGHLAKPVNIGEMMKLLTEILE